MESSFIHTRILILLLCVIVNILILIIWTITKITIYSFPIIIFQSIYVLVHPIKYGDGFKYGNEFKKNIYRIYKYNIFVSLICVLLNICTNNKCKVIITGIIIIIYIKKIILKLKSS